MESQDLIYNELRELKEEIRALRKDNSKFLEILTKHETDLTWVKGSSKILITTLIAGVSGLVVFWLRGLLGL